MEEKHPIKTRQSVFLERYPHAKIGDDGVLDIAPCAIDGEDCRCMGSVEKTCSECKQKYWLEEVPNDD